MGYDINVSQRLPEEDLETEVVKYQPLDRAITTGHQWMAGEKTRGVIHHS